eukprot:CAMPEP_0194028980 /NCGR_PEP_ID=MMETSP0009_2-20130614/2847_1 /TAXON_ID=210454 /ORGANISM="Grammatophora oceanica, Strain CCMP 410" /LENGTH=55 /DNA_ID=CAMNT_0038668537 /DNA_START=801 /DNA_END=968 /DNA_ORIENTATION=+
MMMMKTTLTVLLLVCFAALFANGQEQKTYVRRAQRGLGSGTPAPGRKRKLLMMKS